MVTSIGYLVLGIYCLALFFITCYCLMQFYLLLHYRRLNKRVQPALCIHPLQEYPEVTIQLPIYNERYVLARLIDCICSLDYPKHRMEIQVLDDSTDDTIQISREKVHQYRSLGYNIRVISREERVGYKAGALQHGMQSARGELIAIFDADFLPCANFLMCTVPQFNDPDVGCVQTRWEHLNEEYSLITRLQAFHLNVHFTVEQTGRQAAQLLLQFNGTAGVWRKSAILDAGGWHADTLTEDLDLSYRAQLKGWRIVYLENIGAPAELPAEMQGLKTQQFRWMKGGAETARKILPLLWRSDLSLRKKLFASLHLLSSAIFVCVLITGVLSVPLLFVVHPLHLDLRYFSFLLMGLLVISGVYFVANARTSWASIPMLHKIIRCLWHLPVFLSLSMGLSLHNSIAVIQGFAGRVTSFVRTPKFALRTSRDAWQHRKYLVKKIPLTTFFEGLLALYFLSALVVGIGLKEKAFLVFHAFLMFGYGAICYYTLRHTRLSHS